MGNDTIVGFAVGLGIGVALTLTGGMFFSTAVYRKALKENKAQPDVDSQEHLRRAQEALDDGETLSEP